MKWPYKRRIDPAHAWGVAAVGTAGLVAIPTILATLHASEAHFRWWWPTGWMAIPAIIFLTGVALAVLPVKRPEARLGQGPPVLWPDRVANESRHLGVEVNGGADHLDNGRSVPGQASEPGSTATDISSSRPRAHCRSDISGASSFKQQSYLDDLPVSQREQLAKLNRAGLAALRNYLAAGEAIAFLGPRASFPLYPLPTELIGRLVNAAADRLTETQATTLLAEAAASPSEVVEIVRRVLGIPIYREVLREVLRVRADPHSGKSWTAVHELVCRCAFKAVVTTNYDPGIVDARIRVRPALSATGFTTWEDELGLDRWRTGDVFSDVELPVLYAHGQSNRPDSVVLATSEYRRAYEGKLARVLAQMTDTAHLVWIGSDQLRISAILREIAQASGARLALNIAPRHVVITSWDPKGHDNDPQILAQRAELSYGALLVLYPAPGDDHSALESLLSTLTDSRFPPTDDLGLGATSSVPGVSQRTDEDSSVPMTWMPVAEPIDHFTGRTEELARLDRWAEDPEVGLVGVTAWGGTGKTALVTHWVASSGGLFRRIGLQGVFGWSFYDDPSGEHWASGLLKWVRQQFGVSTRERRLAATVLTVLRATPLLLVLDGLEVLQESPAGEGFGRLLDGTLREVLTTACRLSLPGRIIMTSRFPFADLERFDGGRVRILDVPALSLSEGSALIAAMGGEWLADGDRRQLVEAMDGHALAVGALGGALADRPAQDDLSVLQRDLEAAARTSARVGRVLQFYAARLSESDRYLIAAISLFARPVPADSVLAVAKHPAFHSRLDNLTAREVTVAARDRLGGLVSVQPNESLTAHPLVRDSFRQLALGAATVAANTVLAGVPEGRVQSMVSGQLVVEAIELLLDAGQWHDADALYIGRTGDGRVWKHLPASRLGQRAAAAFVATPARRSACVAQLSLTDQAGYLNAAGLYAMYAGDLTAAEEYLIEASKSNRTGGAKRNLSVNLYNLAESYGLRGNVEAARRAAVESLTYGAHNRQRRCYAHACIAWIAGLQGDPAVAEEQFIMADKLQLVGDRRHLYLLRGDQWANWLLLTGRISAAQTLAQLNRTASETNAWNAELARCDRLLGRVALRLGDTVEAEERLGAAAECFRDGDYLTDLAMTLIDLAELARLSGNLDASEQHVDEALTIAAPRGLVPAQASGLASKAHLAASRATEWPKVDQVAAGRDAADAALRLATRQHLAWHELGALRAHAELDRTEGSDRGWRARADKLHARLVPSGLDPDPLATVERLVGWYPELL